MSLTEINTSIIESQGIESSNLEEDISIVGTLEVGALTSIAGDIEVAGEITSSTGIVGRGTLPIGTILTWVPGYMNSGQTIYTSTGITLPDEWKVCDGTELNDEDSPIFNDSGRYLPKLDDDRFLMGNTVVGGIGGENDGHYHGMGTGADLNITTSGSHNHTYYSYTNATGPIIPMSGSSNAAASASPGTSSASHSHTSGNFAGSIGLVTGGFDGNAVGSNLPKYLACKYIMRVK